MQSFAVALVASAALVAAKAPANYGQDSYSSTYGDSYAAPKNDYSPPKNDYSPPKNDYSPPKNDYSPPKNDYNDYAPKNDYGSNAYSAPKYVPVPVAQPVAVVQNAATAEPTVTETVYSGAGTTALSLGAVLLSGAALLSYF
ncbi:hypothetical protein H4R18_000429 [Coemansia javaensis]|uniref:Uncharacterized protein n=1 Tax=Coemansia javaensis TaxID=2761396 RepID=A0A9W8HPL7_9FUNG|nr:hypothetical protein H4R18_000429 [Coemansia javaensis]